MKHLTLHIVVLLILSIKSKIHPSAPHHLEETTDEGTQPNEEGSPDSKDKEVSYIDEFHIINPQNVHKVYPAMGYDLKHGPLWNIVCITKEFGRIPGKLDVKHRGFFTYDYNVYNCERFFKVNGLLIWNSGQIPDKCVARGKQTDNQKPLYNILAVTQYGNIPGKASSSEHAVFSHEGIRFTSKNFYWLC